MRRGDFAAAWAISDRVLQQRLSAGGNCWREPRHLQWVWNGAPLAGKRVLVRCYHGLGDTIQFIRFAAPLRELAREVIVWAQRELLDLAATAPGVDRVLALHDGAPDVDYDVDIEIMELPHALRVTAASLPRAPYLFPPPRQLPALAPEAFSVGLVWQAGGWDVRRSLPASMVAQIAALPQARFYCLQRGPAAAMSGALGLRDIGSDDIVEAAHRIRQLDLLISVDTMTAHLAGALACPVWTLLHADCDWRWQDGQGASLWYPSMRLFRQDRPNDWSAVVSKVQGTLARERQDRDTSAVVMSDLAR